jgi:glycosyltransferase involved in cell wall biosynthesis
MVDVYERPRQPSGLSLTQRLGWHLHQLTRMIDTGPIAPRLNAVYGSTAFRFSPLIRFCEKRTARALLARRYKIIVTAAYKAPFFHRRRGTTIVYDLVDNHADGLRRAGYKQTAHEAEQFVLRQVGESDLVIVSSLVLRDLARELYGCEALLISNGAQVAAIRDATANVNTRRKYLIGYVGGLENFVRVDIVVQAIERIRLRGIPAELVIVGDGPAINLSWLNVPWIHLLGFRPPDEIPALLSTIRVGVVPFELSPFTDAALPLKVIEYGAARIPVVSSPLLELRRRSFPWLTLVDLDEEAWAEALTKALEISWDSAWDAAVDPFDWRELARQLLSATDSVCGRSAGA